jgi:hypothetical protein
MEQKQFNLLFKVLKILQKEGVLKHLLVVGINLMNKNFGEENANDP